MLADEFDAELEVVAGTMGESSRRLIKGASDFVAVEVLLRVEDRDPLDVPTSIRGILGPRILERGSG